eukprot:jgi/Mesvir1/19627/Mv09916-RA.1
MGHLTVTDALQINEEIRKKLKPRLDAMEEVRGLLNAEGISVPGIVVAGAQSSGKSSVLESISGISLPRGTTITTRAPLMLRLEGYSGHPDTRDWAIIGLAADLSDGEKLDEIADIPEKIISLTNQIAGSGGGITKTPIHLKVFQRDGPTMTLVDLPGITHLSYDDEHRDIHKETSELVKEYISQEQMIVLCTVPAVDDFANTEAIKLAREVDPEGKRTLVVVTKIDNVRPGMKIKEKLRGEGRNVKVAMGMIAVRNRTPTEVDEELPIREARVRERKFFESEEEVKGLEQRYWGTDELVRRIVTVQKRTIDEFLPKIKAKLREELRRLDKELAELAPTLGSEGERRQYFTEAIIKMSSGFKDMAHAMDTRPDRPDLHVAPRTYELYHAFASYLCDSEAGVVPDFLSAEYSDTVREAMKETRGATLPNFLSQPVFKQLVLSAFASPIKDGIEDLVSDLRKYVEKVVGVLMDEAFGAHPSLLDTVKGDMLPRFLDSKESGLKSVLDMVARAETHIFTLNPQYMKLVTAAGNEANARKTMPIGDGAAAVGNGGMASVGGIVGILKEGGAGVFEEFMNKVVASVGNEDEAVLGMQINLFSYAQIVTRRLSDIVPMLCHESLVTSLHEQLAGFMAESVTQACLEECLAEDPDTMATRAQKAQTRERFAKCMEVLQHT